jgi:hypothetical protein
MEKRIQKAGAGRKAPGPSERSPRLVGRPLLGMLQRTAVLEGRRVLLAVTSLSQTRSPSRHFLITSSSIGKGTRKRKPMRTAPTRPELIHL